MDAAVTVTSGDSLVVPRNAGREEECELAKLCVNNPSFHFFSKMLGYFGFSLLDCTFYSLGFCTRGSCLLYQLMNGAEEGYEAG